MAMFIVRRLVASLLILLAASFVVYIAMSYTGDPLGFLVDITDPIKRAAVEKAVIDQLDLDKPLLQRYVSWLGDFVTGDFGQTARFQTSLNEELGRRIPLTLRLVGAASIISIVLGTTTGILTALRQYSGFDYLVTFVNFLFFSLPVFWIAVILKETGGIQLNDWLRDSAEFSTSLIIVAAALAALVGFSVSDGKYRRRVVVAVLSSAGVAGLMVYLSAVKWFQQPGIGLPVLIPLALGIAVGATAIFAGIGNRKALYSALTTAAVGCIVYLPLQGLFDRDSAGWLMMLGLLIVTLGVGTIVGFAYGGYDKALSARLATFVGFCVAFVIFVDRHLQSWQEYASSSVIRNRPIKTIGTSEPRLEGSFWVLNNDVLSHLVLPTLTLMLISLAAYTRYSRASMLEVLNQDYIRTARAKGLSERTVIVRHGLRNALIPVATIVALDIGALLGGAIITETVFQWDGMGKLFVEGLRNFDPEPVMAATMVVGFTALMANLLADIAYSILDPRIRLHS